MRIISGQYRGRKIVPPRNFKARPTTDFAKEGLFNILVNQFDLEEVEVLDLFAGTGSITYEFASRGARSVVAVEWALPHQRFIQHTCLSLEMDRVTVLRMDAFRFLQHPVQSFDIVFADPPYDLSRLEEIPDGVLGSGVLNPDGILI
ncbi:MAG: RsmD family RNA methyltransferase, partial [Bacteroidales bacterium]